MSRIKLRYPKIDDAQRFLEILSNPKFIYISANPKSIEDEIDWIKLNSKLRKQNLAWNYAIILEKQIIGSIGIMINPHRPYVGEMGYFTAEEYWNMGITTEAVKMVEEKGFTELGLKRIEIKMEPENESSERVAIKCGYHKEALLKKAVANKTGEMRDVLLYAKIFDHK
ncbi:MAG: GNAT family N-acetyltransferase [Bacteroidales bacterium]|nr:GNAT family N-acetyltransferase [Bacteroidales bacterium]